MSTPLPEQQDALLITAKGARMIVDKRPVPKPGADQVLVRNITVALNPIDWVVQKTGMFIQDEWLPVVAGCDAAGEVCAIAEGVEGWSIGDKVFYPGDMANDRRPFQEYTVVDAARMARIPPNLTFEQAATISLGISTAALGIYERKSSEIRPDGFDRGGTGITPPWVPEGKGKYAGQAALVLGGASSVGQYAIQLLKASGYSPLITTASAHNEDYCKAAGATHVIDYKTVPYDQLPVAVKTILGDTPVSLIYDAVSRGTQKIVFPLLAPGGGMVTVQPPEVGKRGQDDEQGRRVIGVFGGVNEEEHKALGAEMYAHLTEFLEKGILKPNRVKVIEGGLAGIPAGCDELEKGVSGIKLVARIRE